MKIAKFKIINLSLMILFVFGFFGIHQTSASLVPKSPANLGLVGYWNFEEGRGNKAMDHSGNANTGTLTNFALSGATSNYVAGKTGTALDFDGSNDYVEVADTATYQNQDFSASFWIKLGATQANAITALIDYEHSKAIGGAKNWVIQSEDATTNRYYYLAYWNGSTFEPSGQYGVGKGIQLTPGIWQHLVYTKSGTTVRGYVNGVVNWSPTAAGSSTVSYETRKLRIGDWIHHGAGLVRYFNGSMDEVRIYNRALTASEVTALYSQGAKIMKTKNAANLGLVGYWNFEEGRGNKAIDHSGNGNTGTLTNFALSGATSNYVAGKTGTALNFDGVNDYVSTANNPTTATTNITISGWIKWAGNNTRNQTLFYNGYSGSNGYGLYIDTSNVLHGLAGGVAVINLASPFTPTVGIWYHIVLTRGVSNWQIYIDGASQGVSSSSNPNTPAQHFEIGSDVNIFNGSIDEVRIYNRALTASEVTDLYNQNKNLKLNSSQNTSLTSGLVGLWSFDGTDLSTTTATDRSGSGNNGTLTGASGTQNKPQPTIGKIGQALNFDGTDDYVDAGANSSLNFGTGSFTASAWIKTSAAARQTILEKFDYDGAGASHETGYYIDVQANGKLRTAIEFSGTNYKVRDSSGTVNNNVWHHVVMVRNGTDVYPDAYIDGVLSNGTTLNQGSVNDINTTEPFRIGYQSDKGVTNSPFSVNFTGSLDNVRVYNRALSATEVLQLYNMGK